MKKLFSNRFFNFFYAFVLFLCDIMTILLCFWLGYQLWVQSSWRVYSSPPVFNIVHFLIGSLVFVGVLIWGGTYKLESSIVHILELRGVIRSTLVGFGVVVVIGFFTKSLLIGRLQATYTLLLLVPCIVIERFLIDNLWAIFISKMFGQKCILIYGAGDTGKRLAKSIRKYPKLNYKVVGFLDDEKSVGTIMTSDLIPALGDLSVVPSLIKSQKIDEIWIAIPKANSAHVVEVMNTCTNLGLSYKFVPSLNKLAFHHVRKDELDGVPLFGVRTLSISTFNLFIKRIFDIVFSLFVLILMSPVMGIVALFIKRDSPGPAIFRQRRVGLKGKEFVLYKFRTLYVETPPYVVNPLNGNDPRITKFGRFLRKTSLDEFPQFWNVLRGEMSVVGPRPEMPFIVETYNDVHRERLNVKPGITGLWQISGDRALPIHENVDYDFYYIEHQSSLLDLIIVFETIIFAIKGRGAY